MSDSEEEDILFLRLAVLFKMKKKKERKRKIWVWELFRKREEKGAFNNLIQIALSGFYEVRKTHPV